MSEIILKDSSNEVYCFDCLFLNIGDSLKVGIFPYFGPDYEFQYCDRCKILFNKP